MNKIIITLVAAGLLSTTAAMAQTQVTFSDLDTDVDGELSLTELQVAWPLTQDEFAAADLDVSGSLSADEVVALQSASATTLPGTEQRPVQSFRSDPDVAPGFPDALTEN